LRNERSRRAKRQNEYERDSTEIPEATRGTHRGQHTSETDNIPINLLVQGVGVEPTMGKIPADFKPAAYANFASPAPANAANKEYHALRWFPYSVAAFSG
jgi:hypothetical protein